MTSIRLGFAPTRRSIFSAPGAVEAEAKQGDMTLCRFDGDNGEYSLLLGNARGIDGPYTKGTYVWFQFFMRPANT